MDQIRIYNPLLKDFEYIWYDDHNEAHTLRLPSLVITTLPKSQGEFMLKHLTDEIINTRGNTKKGHDAQAEEIKKEVEVTDDLL